MFLGIYPFHPGCPICWDIVAHIYFLFAACVLIFSLFLPSFRLSFFSVSIIPFCGGGSLDTTFFLLFKLLQLFPLSPFLSLTQPHPLLTPSQSPYYCLYPWFVHKCSWPFTIFHPIFPLLSSNRQSVLCI